MKRSLLRNEIKKTRRSNWFFFQANFVSYRLVHQQIYSYWLLRLHAPKRLNYFSSGTIINIGIVYAHIYNNWVLNYVQGNLMNALPIWTFSVSVLFGAIQSDIQKIVTSPHSTQTHPPSLSLNNIHLSPKRKKKEKNSPKETISKLKQNIPSNYQNHTEIL